jgi:Flp pilus assembly pilin Flp
VKNETLPKSSLWNLLKRVHRNERGAVSIETVLIIAAIALPILIFIIKFGWPRIKEFFDKGMQDLEEGAEDAGDADF